MVSRRAFAAALRALLDNGFRFTIIGGSVISIAAELDDMGDDIDLFAESPSVVEAEEAYGRAADLNHWDLGQTWLGTPRITMVVEAEEVPVEFYDNLYDFYVPERFIHEAKRVDVEGVKVKVIKPEEYLALKGRAGREEDLEGLKRVADLVKRGRLKVSYEEIEKAVEEFDEAQIIMRRLREAGIIRA
ncbi:MAG: putative nucleotidyltransferase [uncultured Acidilobus sp. JCHS]|jgi:Predicted nucleotidyltransferase|nr:MAG: putative nucleotidyltransferase [uncultured Acidilobus sp. JCHS]